MGRQLTAVEIDQAESSGLEQTARHLVLPACDRDTDEFGALGLPPRDGYGCSRVTSCAWARPLIELSS
jgi:hypothetical protein